MQADEAGSVSAGGCAAPPEGLAPRIARAVADAGGWLPFDDFMALALYAPGAGYYARGDRQFGRLAGSGSDFVTAPELSPLFARALARQVAQALAAAGADTVWEFGAGSGALAEGLLAELDGLGLPPVGYRIVDLSGALRARQQARLARFGARVQWLDQLPERFDGVIVGNEVLDAMPVKLLHLGEAGWCERGVALAPGGGFAFADRPTALRPPLDPGWLPGTTLELPQQAPAFVRSVCERIGRGAAFFVDYGFPEAELYHPQRSAGTLMCHRGHRSDDRPLEDPGDKDITAHVDFTAVAVAAQEAGAEVLGYTSQARFLFNCGLQALLEAAPLTVRADATRLVSDHEMGELFKVIGLARGLPEDFGLAALGFRDGDRSHRL
ncbi:class I SAM-dependent methyltransferase [Piscinibacter sakaiensis]|uniref:COG1565 family protein n=1 Tax=Piscinibacter sakaiensis TaxID=1547922 RepID=A0A0K8P4X7_PISS1|nr:SAM-dependent methyltransferase [Piscinibacter sakaiensis]GAP37743.1 COG1565 family protein [Piscinibacter sakaiensis]